MGLQIRDYQVKKNIRWHILRLLRLNSKTKQELIDKLSEMYLGYWQVNNKLIDSNLNSLVDECLIQNSSLKKKALPKKQLTSYTYEITEKGLDALGKNERKIEQHLTRGFSKETCAKYSLEGNVGLSALESQIN